MSTTKKQRYYGQARENQIKYKFNGQARLLQVILNYEGSQSPLTCSIDGDNLRQIAIKSGVKDIVSLYDNGSTQFHPNKENVINQFIAMAGRCQPGDILVFQYSGHGTRVQDQDGDEEDGYDEAICLTSTDGENQNFTDDQMSKMVGQYMNPLVPILFLMDCCHSGTVLDLTKPGIWANGKKVCAISGCQDNQYSGDTGNGGVMTNSLIKAITKKSCKKRRKHRTASIQFVFNRMVDNMPQEEQEEMEEMEEGDEEWEPEWEEIEGAEEFEWDEDELEQGQEDDMDENHQTLNISWNGATDPIRISFPF